MSAPTIPGLEQLGEEIKKKFPPLNIEGRIQKILPKAPDKPKDERSLIEKGLDWGAKRVAPKKPDTQQVQEWNTAQRVRNFYKSPQFQQMPDDKKLKAEKWLYNTKVVPQFKQSGKNAPSFEDWIKFRSDPNFPKAQMQMFDYFEPRGTAANIAEELGGRVTRSIYGGLENLFMLHAVGLDYLHGGMKPEELDTSKLSSFDLSIYNFLEKAKAGASQIIDKNSPVNASWGRKIAEGTADNALMFTVAGKVGTTLGAATATEGVTGIAGKFPWALTLAKTPIGRLVLNRIIGAADSATAQAMSGGGVSPEKVALGALGPRGMPGPIQKIFKTKTAQNLPGQVLQDVSPEVKEAAQKLGANLGVTMGAKATAAVAHGAAIKAETPAAEKITDPVVEKTTKAVTTLYDRVAQAHGYTSYNDIPRNQRPAFINTVLDNMIQGMKNPAAVDPELTQFMVQHDSAEAAQKFPEYAQNIAAIEQTAKTQGVDSTKTLADDTFKEAGKDLPKKEFVSSPHVARPGEPIRGLARGAEVVEGKIVPLMRPLPKPESFGKPVERVTPPEARGRWGTWDVEGHLKWLAEQQAAEFPPQAIKPKEAPPSPKPSPTKEPGMGPGAAHKGDIAFEDVLRHLTKGDMVIENELHQFIQVWGMYKDSGKLTPQIEQNTIDVIKNNLPPGVNERYVTPNLLEKWWNKLKFHKGEMVRTGHTPEGGDPRGVFRSTKLGGQPTTWQKQLYSEPTVRETPKEAPKKGVHRRPKLLGADD